MCQNLNILIYQAFSKAAHEFRQLRHAQFPEKSDQLNATLGEKVLKMVQGAERMKALIQRRQEVCVSTAPSRALPPRPIAPRPHSTPSLSRAGEGAGGEGQEEGSAGRMKEEGGAAGGATGDATGGAARPASASAPASSYGLTAEGECCICLDNFPLRNLQGEREGGRRRGLVGWWGVQVGGAGEGENEYRSLKRRERMPLPWTLVPFSPLDCCLLSILVRVCCLSRSLKNVNVSLGAVWTSVRLPSRCCGSHRREVFYTCSCLVACRSSLWEP